MKHKPNHSFSFLMEFIIVLFFFACSSMICVQIFSISVTKNRTANDTKEALELAQQYIEGNSDYECGSFSQDGYDFEINASNDLDEHYEITVKKDDKELVSLPFFPGNDE